MQTTSESAQLLAAIAQQNELLAQILHYLKQPHSIKLGLTEAPASLKIYANRSNGGLWYTVKDGEVQPIGATALTGYLQEIKFEQVERRGKPVTKLQAYFKGDRPYCIESGYDSHFSKGLMAAIASMERDQLQQPITLQPQPGQDESVLFCRVYDVAGEPIKVSYNDETDWRSISVRAIKNIREKAAA